jgi:hypothetical protein
MQVVAWIAFGFSLISLLAAVAGVLQIVMDKWRSGQRMMTITVIQVHWTAYAFHLVMIVLAGVAVAGGCRRLGIVQTPFLVPAGFIGSRRL